MESVSAPLTAVLGASNNPGRYSFKAVAMLKEYGHTVAPVHPALDVVAGIPVFASLADVPGQIDTVSVYVNAERLEKLIDEIIVCRPRRVIFNPGTESPVVRERLEAAGVHCVEACTLVLLRTGQYGSV